MNVLRHLWQGENGAISVMVGLMFPIFLMFGVLAVDVGNWYVHKRELQTQADAGALAGAAFFKFPCSDSPIAAAAQSYAGGSHNIFNNIPSTRETYLLNAQDFSGQSTPNDMDLTGSPCTDDAVDVKMTETNVPWFFGSLFTPHINAQARVSIRRLDSLKGLLPIGVPVPNPKRVRVTFISEVTGETLGYKDLCQRTSPQNGMQIWDNSTSNSSGWSSSAGACTASASPSGLSLPFDSSKYDRVGTIVQMSGSASQIACTDPLVTCFTSATTGLGFIHGWSDQPAVTGTSAPQPRSVVLLPGTCGDAYFNTSSTTCSIGISAAVDFQSGEFTSGGNIRTIQVNNKSTPVITATANVTTSGSTANYPLTYSSSTKRWTTSAISIAPASGASTVKIRWTQIDNTVGTTTCTPKSPCTGTFANVLQRTVAANSTVAGPIGLLQIGDASSTSGVDDLQECSSTNATCGDSFVITVGITGVLQLAQPTDPATVLRVIGGSQTQAIDCDPSIPSLKGEIEQGCGPSYGRNTGQSCPDHGQSGTQPAGTTWYCVWTQTGQSPSQVSAGFNYRILGNEKATVCTAPNHWPNYQPNDPRILPLFVVPYGAFQGSGNASFPVQDFAFFYITGWTGQGNGFNNPCQGNGDDPVPNNDAGDIVGHFIKYVETPNTGGGGDTPCDLSGGSLSGCVAVMTR